MTERRMLALIVTVLTMACVNGRQGPSYCAERCRRCSAGRELYDWAVRYAVLYEPHPDPSDVI